MRKFLEKTAFLYQADDFATCGGGGTRTECFSFELIESGTAYAVTGLSLHSAKDIVIPAAYNGLPVTQIKARAFFAQEHLTTVVMPNTITVVGDSAFARCNHLTALEFSNNLEKLAESVFEGCSSLKSVRLPDGFTFMMGYVFYLCSGLQRVIIPKSISGIGYKSFEGCNSLREVFYKGTEDDWRGIRIQPNENLLKAKIYYPI